MTLTYTVLYSREANFDFEYYTKKHLALTEKVFGNVLVDWKAVRYVEDGQTPFKVMATLVFTSREEHEAVMASKIGATLLDDIKNYSNMAPVMMQQTDSACKKEM